MSIKINKFENVKWIKGRARPLCFPFFWIHRMVAKAAEEGQGCERAGDDAVFAGTAYRLP